MLGWLPGHQPSELHTGLPVGDSISSELHTESKEKFNMKVNIRRSAAGVGAWSLVEHAKVLEAELKAGLPVNPERVDDIEMAVEELRVFIAERLALDEPGIH